MLYTMTTFYFKAKRGSQEIVEDTVEADNMDNAVTKIMQMGFVPIDVEKTRKKVLGKTRTISSSTLKFQFKKKISSFELALFTRQVSDLLGAGVPLLRVMELILKQNRNPRFSSVIQQMYEQIRDGGSFSFALSQSPDIFSSIYVHMVKSGELSGQLDQVMLRLADFIEKDYESQSQLKSSLIYPSLIFGLGSLTVFVLMTWIIPRITTIFEDFDQALPWPTALLISLSKLLTSYWWVFLILIFICIGLFRRFISKPEGRFYFDSLILRIPLIGEYIKNVNLGRLSHTLGTLLQNGISMVEALESTVHIVQNTVLRQDLEDVLSKVVNGSRLASALQESKFFPETMTNMIAIGEESGSLHESLNKLAQLYERSTQRLRKTFISLVEPILILIMGSIIGFVIVAMLMPIFKMNLMIG